MRKIDLIYFEGCPNVSRARQNLRDAIAATGGALTWSEWDVTSEATPADLRRFTSPTVLVDGCDVSGGAGESVATACRLGGAPSVEAISRRLARVENLGGGTNDS